MMGGKKEGFTIRKLFKIFPLIFFFLNPFFFFFFFYALHMISWGLVQSGPLSSVTLRDYSQINAKNVNGGKKKRFENFNSIQYK